MNLAVRQSLPILSPVVGFLLKQVGLIRSGDSQVMARRFINTTLPAVIFLSIARANVAPAKMVLLALCGVLVRLGPIIISGVLVSCLGLERQIAGAVMLATMIIGLTAGLRIGGGFLLGQALVLLIGLHGLDKPVLLSVY